MKMFTRNTLGMVCGASMLLASGLAGAGTISDCQSQIGTLRGATDGTIFGGNNPQKTEASLLSKLDGASIKLDYAKFDDALQKMQQYHDEVVNLAVANGKGETKLDPAVSGDLAGQAADIIYCIQNIGL